jgi:hypothetical protein
MDGCVGFAFGVVHASTPLAGAKPLAYQHPAHNLNHEGQWRLNRFPVSAYVAR